MKKRILVQTKNVSFNKVKKLLYELENNFFLEFFITDDTYIISKKYKKTLRDIVTSNDYVCSIDFVNNKSLREILFNFIINLKMINLKAFLNPKVRHNFKNKKNFNYILKNCLNYRLIWKFIIKKMNSLVKHHGIILAGTYKQKLVNKKYPIKIFSHSIDYENFCDEKIINREIEKKEKKKILFIDEMIQHHPDYFIENIHAPISYENYISGMNSLFKKIESNTSYTPGIAFHPKSDQKYINDFTNVKKNFLTTIQAIKKADIIIAHASTAIGIAALLKKPIILLIFEEMRDSWMESYVLAMASQLNCKVFFLNEFLNQINDEFFAKLENQNNENYDYVNKFIIHPKKKDNFNISQTIKLFLDKINDAKD